MKGKLPIYLLTDLDLIVFLLKEISEVTRFIFKTPLGKMIMHG